MKSFNDLLAWGPVSLVRRNHGLEHATLTLLSEQLPHTPFAGYSDPKGFWVVGNVSTDQLLETVQKALRRMKSGEHSLAVHPYCGTNFVTAGLIAGSLAWLTSLGKANNFTKKLNRWPLMVMVVTGAFVASQPLGPKVQAKISTCGEPGNLVVTQIVRYERQGRGLHRILTADQIPSLES